MTLEIFAEPKADKLVDAVTGKDSAPTQIVLDDPVAQRKIQDEQFE